MLNKSGDGRKEMRHFHRDGSPEVQLPSRRMGYDAMKRDTVETMLNKAGVGRGPPSKDQVEGWYGQGRGLSGGWTTGANRHSLEGKPTSPEVQNAARRTYEHLKHDTHGRIHNTPYGPNGNLMPDGNVQNLPQPLQEEAAARGGQRIIERRDSEPGDNRAAARRNLIISRRSDGDGSPREKQPSWYYKPGRDLAERRHFDAGYVDHYGEISARPGPGQGYPGMYEADLEDEDVVRRGEGEEYNRGGVRGPHGGGDPPTRYDRRYDDRDGRGEDRLPRREPRDEDSNASVGKRGAPRYGESASCCAYHASVARESLRLRAPSPAGGTNDRRVPSRAGGVRGFSDYAGAGPDLGFNYDGAFPDNPPRSPRAVPAASESDSHDRAGLGTGTASHAARWFSPEVNELLNDLRRVVLYGNREGNPLKQGAGRLAFVKMQVHFTQHLCTALMILSVCKNSCPIGMSFFVNIVLSSCRALARTVLVIVAGCNGRG